MILACVLLIAILYPLSAGPAVMLADRGILSNEVFIQFYLPCLWFDDHVLPDRHLFKRYVSLWSPPVMIPQET